MHFLKILALCPDNTSMCSYHRPNLKVSTSTSCQLFSAKLFCHAQGVEHRSVNTRGQVSIRANFLTAVACHPLNQRSIIDCFVPLWSMEWHGATLSLLCAKLRLRQATFWKTSTPTKHGSRGFPDGTGQLLEVHIDFHTYSTFPLSSALWFQKNWLAACARAPGPWEATRTQSTTGHTHENHQSKEQIFRNIPLSFKLKHIKDSIQSCVGILCSLRPWYCPQVALWKTFSHWQRFKILSLRNLETLIGLCQNPCLRQNWPEKPAPKSLNTATVSHFNHALPAGIKIDMPCRCGIFREEFGPSWLSSMVRRLGCCGRIWFSIYRLYRSRRQRNRGLCIRCTAVMGSTVLTSTSSW